jgi:hypothetical protein
VDLKRRREAPVNDHRGSAPVVQVAEGKEVNRHLRITLVTTAGAVVAILVLLSIVALFALIDWGNW